MKKVLIYEMFMRDGLQSLSKIYSYDEKVLFLNKLLKSNIKNIEFGSTTNPKLLPQMKDSYEILNYIKENNLDKEEYKFTMLISNINNLKKCIELNLKSFGLLCSLDDDFSYKNLNKSSLDSLNTMLEQLNFILNKDETKKLHIRLYISFAFNENNNDLLILLNKINDILNFTQIDSEYLDIVLCDTIAIVNEIILENSLNCILNNNKELIKYLSLHFHRKNDFENLINIALKYGINKFDSSILNVGGCPFSEDDKQNINTIKLIKHLYKNNYETNIDINLLESIEKDIEELL